MRWGGYDEQQQVSVVVQRKYLPADTGHTFNEGRRNEGHRQAGRRLGWVLSKTTVLHKLLLFG